MTIETAAPPTCERTIRVNGEDRACRRSVAVRSWYDSAGTLHRACPLHYAERLHRYPASDPPEPSWLHEMPDAVDEAKREADRSWTDAGGELVGYHDWQARP